MTKSGPDAETTELWMGKEEEMDKEMISDADKGTKTDDDTTVKKQGPKPKNKRKFKIEVQKKILAYLGQSLQVDRKNVPKQEVALGCGVQSARTHGFFYAWQDLEKNKHWIAKSQTEKGTFCLTDAGKDNIPNDVVLVAVRNDNAGKLELFRSTLLKQCKEAKPDKVAIIFDILKDGKPHALGELTEATGYVNLKSKGLGYPLSFMEKKMKTLEKLEGKLYQFTDKCFPEGRP